MPLYRLTNGVELWAHCECTRADRRVLRRYREQCEEYARLCVEISPAFIRLESSMFEWNCITLRRVNEIFQSEPCVLTRNIVFTNDGLKLIKIQRYNNKPFKEGGWNNIWLFVARLAKVMQYWKIPSEWRSEWPEEFK